MKNGKILIEPIKVFLLRIISFFNFAGFYTVLIFLISAGMLGTTRVITVPLRAMVAFCFLFLFFLSNKVKFQRQYILFYIYVIVYLLRLLYDMSMGRLTNYYITGDEILLFFIFFVIFPFFVLSSVRLSEYNYDVILKSIIFSTFTFSVVSFSLYSKFIGTVRILATSTTGEEVINHLALAYGSMLGIGLCGIYLISKKGKKIFKTYLFIIIGLCLIMFFLASGRGAAVTLIVVALFYLIAQKRMKRRIRTLIIFLFFSFIMIWLLETSGSGLLNRFDKLFNDSGTLNTEDSRIPLWIEGWNQFLTHPIVGSGIALENSGGYVHNIFIEVLYTTGIVGFIPFIWLVILAFKKTFNIFRYHRYYSWIGVLFIIGFMEHVVSGAVYTGIWLWFAMGLLFSFDGFIKRKQELSSLYQRNRLNQLNINR